MLLQRPRKDKPTLTVEGGASVFFVAIKAEGEIKECLLNSMPPDLTHWTLKRSQFKSERCKSVGETQYQNSKVMETLVCNSSGKKKNYNQIPPLNRGFDAVCCR